jgi:hypothetical protein
MSIPRDVQEFLDEYPGVMDDPSSTENLEFYSNNLRCRPDNRTIDEIHERYCTLHVDLLTLLISSTVDGSGIMENWRPSTDIYNGCTLNSSFLSDGGSRPCGR